MDLGLAQPHQTSKLRPWVRRFIPGDCDVFLAVGKSVIKLETSRSEVRGLRAAVADRMAGNDVVGLQFRGKPEDGTVRACRAASCPSPPRDLLFSLAIAETSGIESRSPPLNMALSQASGNDESSYRDKS